MFGDVFLRFASNSSVSGELGGETACRLMLTASVFDSEAPGAAEVPEAAEVVAVTAKLPSELLASNVPFLGGLPILLPVFENLVLAVTADNDDSAAAAVLLPLPVFVGLKALPPPTLLLLVFPVMFLLGEI